MALGKTKVLLPALASLTTIAKCTVVHFNLVPNIITAFLRE